VEKLAQKSVAAFAEELGSASPAPGGGSTAALAGALGAALAGMVCRLSAGKPALAPYGDELEDVRASADALRAKLLEAMDRDTEAFLTVSDAFALPKSTDEEKAARSAAIQRGLALCTETPLEVMALAAEALALLDRLPGKFNTAAASDFGVGALALGTALRGAWLNVCINIGSLKDRAAAEGFRQRGEALLAQALPVAERLYQAAVDAI